LKLPPAIKIIAALLIASPLFNYVFTAYKLNLRLDEPLLVFRNLSLLVLFLFFAPAAAGLGLMRIRRWGWRLFVGYGIILIAYNTSVLLRRLDGENIFLYAHTIIALILMFYFLRKDIAAPYFSLETRGRRRSRRTPASLNVSINGETKALRDISRKGIYVLFPSCPLRLNSRTEVILNAGKESIVVTGGIVRIDQDGVGIAFRDMNRKLWKKVSRALKEEAAQIAS